MSGSADRQVHPWTAHGSGLRSLAARTALATGLAAFVLSVLLAVAAYALAASELSQRALREVRRHAEAGAEAYEVLVATGRPPDAALAATSLDPTSASVVVDEAGRAVAARNIDGPSAAAAVASLSGEAPSTSGRLAAAGREWFAGAVRIDGGRYVELDDVEVLSGVLGRLVTVLALGVAAATVLGTLFGIATSRRVLRPLTQVATAARAIALGGLTTRLALPGDRDLATLVEAFNGMATSLQARVERDRAFAADAAHELRTPLTAIASAVDVLVPRRDELSSAGREALDVLRSEVTRVTQMVADLLELSELDARAAELRLQTTPLGSFVEAVVRRLGYRELPVEVAAGTDDVPVALDRRRLERVLANLLENAKVHGDGAVRVEVHRAGDDVVVAVEDAGRGIPPEERQRVFERFARSSASRHRSKGTGLGLALVHEHVRAHGGRVGIEDRAGGGARVVVRLPVVAAPPGDEGADPLGP